jgi:hypothetical protein
MSQWQFGAGGSKMLRLRISEIDKQGYSCSPGEYLDRLFTLILHGMAEEMQIMYIAHWWKVHKNKKSLHECSWQPHRFLKLLTCRLSPQILGSLTPNPPPLRRWWVIYTQA